MSVTDLVRTLARNDGKLIGRDRFLILVFVYGFAMAAGLRFILPWMDGYLAAEGVLSGGPDGMRLSETFPMVVGYIGCFVGALLPGTVFGFLLLEEKEHETLTALRVTPVPLRRYLVYRVALPALLSLPMILGLILLMGLELLPWWQLALISTAGALTAPIVTLFFATFADNRVQGFALTKFTGLAGVTILVGWFVREPLQWVFGLFPPFLVSKAYWLALEGRAAWIPVLAASVVTQLLLAGWMLHRFRETLGES